MNAFAQPIVAHLTLASNGAMPVAIAWHVAGAIALFGLACGWRPSKRRAGLLLAAPVASAAAVAFVFGNPFNVAVLTALTLALVVLASRLDSGRIARGSTLTTAVGGLTIAFGFAYPHFLEGASVLTYAYGAPTGVVPCPTLAVVVGVTLAANGLGSRAWSLTIAAAGLFYGIVGVVLLEVVLDLVLTAASIALVAATLLDSSRRYSSVT